jgi:hypothetical protein
MAFLRKTRIENVNKDFTEIIKRITDFLKPVIIAIIGKKDMETVWNVEKGSWGKKVRRF